MRGDRQYELFTTVHAYCISLHQNHNHSPNDTSQVLEICDHNLSVMKPQHLSDGQAITASDPNFHANLVGKYGAMQLKASMKKKKKSQQNKEAPGGCGWKAPRKHELDVDSQPPHMHEHVADYSKLYTQSRSLHET